jgi:hypothetical protein
MTPAEYAGPLPPRAIGPFQAKIQLPDPRRAPPIGLM